MRGQSQHRIQQDTSGYVPYSPPREGPIHQDTCDTSDFHAPGARTSTRYNGIRCDTFASCLACPAPGPPRYNTIRSLWGDRDKARYDRIRLDTLLFGRLLLDADMPGDDCCVHTQQCLSSSSRVLLASKNLKENPILACRNQLRATCPARTGMTASTCLRFLLCLETSCSSQVKFKAAKHASISNISTATKKWPTSP